MKKVALVFVLAVFVPSLVLAWLAVRSLRDQQFVLERQQSLLYQGATDSLARDVAGLLSEQQRDFRAKVGAFLDGQSQENVEDEGRPGNKYATGFDAYIRKEWPLAEVGFCVSLTEGMLCPSPDTGLQAKMFCADNAGFLVNRESAEVYWTNSGNMPALDLVKTKSASVNGLPALRLKADAFPTKAQTRKVTPVQQSTDVRTTKAAPGEQPISKVVVADAPFQLLIGDTTDGILARFIQNKLRLMFWHRESMEPQLVFGAQLDLARLIEQIKAQVASFDPTYRQGIAIAILNDQAKPVAVSPAGFQANWTRPFVATELGEALPHWEAAAYLLDPQRLARSANITKLTFGLLIALLVVAIAVGSWLIVSDLNRQLTLARQKTDFVSNVSHELKTPLTSIRMFSELLAGNKVADTAKQRSYLQIIATESARLTRLINNVLDFARIERGEKKYNFQPCNLNDLLTEVVESFRPHLESNGFRLDFVPPDSPVRVQGDRDALAQVMVNLLSNAEKYSGETKEISVTTHQHRAPVRHVEVRVADRGIGVPEGGDERIFEQFYRAHDSLSSGIQGSGLGLTLARQIARAHGGDVAFERREDGGSCFTLRLPCTD